jgi:hypothetical protein
MHALTHTHTYTQLTTHIPLQTSKSFLHIYNIHVSKDPLLPGVPAARDLCKTDIYMRHSAQLEQEATCIAGRETA